MYPAELDAVQAMAAADGIVGSAVAWTDLPQRLHAQHEAKRDFLQPSVPPEEEQGGEGSVTARDKRRREAESLRRKQENQEQLKHERQRRLAARNFVELAYLEHAIEAAGFFDRKALEAFLRERLGDDRALTEVEAAAASFPDLIRKRAAKQRLMHFYYTNRDVLTHYYPFELFERFLQSNLDDDRSVAEVEESERRLLEKLQLLAQKEIHERGRGNRWAIGRDDCWSSVEMTGNSKYRWPLLISVPVCVRGSGSA